MIARDLLSWINAQTAIALAALEDEREGDFTRAVEQIYADAEQLLELVRSW